MPLWVELLVFMLIVYGAVLAVMMSWLQRRARLARLTRERAKRQVAKDRTRAGKPVGERIGKSEDS